MEILIYSLRLYYLQVKLHSSFTQHEMAKKESKEGRKLAPEILGPLHPFLFCIYSSLQCCLYPSSWIRSSNTGVSWVLALTVPESPGLPLAAFSQALGLSVKASAAGTEVKASWWDVLHLHPSPSSLRTYFV